jgi:hypothetical protein
MPCLRASRSHFDVATPQYGGLYNQPFSLKEGCLGETLTEEWPIDGKGKRTSPNRNC